MRNTDEDLEGLRVLVTGGSRGLSEATARRCIPAGAAVLTDPEMSPK